MRKEHGIATRTWIFLAPMGTEPTRICLYKQWKLYCKQHGIEFTLHELVAHNRQPRKDRAAGGFAEANDWPL